jgi:hypothetical protein
VIPPTFPTDEVAAAIVAAGAEPDREGAVQRIDAVLREMQVVKALLDLRLNLHKIECAAGDECRAATLALTIGGLVGLAEALAPGILRPPALETAKRIGAAVCAQAAAALRAEHLGRPS